MKKTQKLFDVYGVVASALPVIDGGDNREVQHGAAVSVAIEIECLLEPTPHKRLSRNSYKCTAAAFQSTGLTWDNKRKAAVIACIRSFLDGSTGEGHQYTPRNAQELLRQLHGLLSADIPTEYAGEASDECQ